MRETADIIFCRNVMIYFDRPTQESCCSDSTGSWRPAAIIFMGHSETLSGLDVSLTSVFPTVYRKFDEPNQQRTVDFFLKPGEIVLGCEPMRSRPSWAPASRHHVQPAAAPGRHLPRVLPSCQERSGPAVTGFGEICAVRRSRHAGKVQAPGRSELEAKLFGGSDMFDTAGMSRVSVGQQNGRWRWRCCERRTSRHGAHGPGGGSTGSEDHSSTPGPERSCCDGLSKTGDATRWRAKVQAKSSRKFASSSSTTRRWSARP